MLAIVAAYLTFVGVGTFVMKRLPGDGFRFYGLSFVYNIVQVMLCSYMCIESLVIALRQGYTLTPCNTFDVVGAPVAKVLWLFYMSKVLDFMDTFFIVMKKNWKQLTFLHVYHHSTIFAFYWLNLNAGYDGDIFLPIILNGAIHTVMYTYYFVSLHTRDIWWKKYLTMCQMVQFGCMNVQAVYLLGSGCTKFPPRLTAMYFVYIVSMFGLFAHFFVQSYTKKPTKKTA